MHGVTKAGSDRVEHIRRATNGKTISVRSGKNGLGDGLYLQSVVRYFVQQGYYVEACSRWPELFIPLKDRVKVVPFRRDNVDRIAHYSIRMLNGSPTDQFVDCCMQAEIKEPVELKLDWTITRHHLVDLVKREAKGKPIVLVQLPREPMGREDGFARDLLPKEEAYQQAIRAVSDRALIVQVGKGNPIYELKNVDVDLSDRTSISDLLDLAMTCDAMLGYVSYFVPLAESFDKNLLCVWSRKGLRSREEYLRRLTPQKIFHKRSCRAVMDDESGDNIAEASRSLLG
jgi:hypothetical protein